MVAFNRVKQQILRESKRERTTCYTPCPALELSGLSMQHRCHLKKDVWLVA